MAVNLFEQCPVCGGEIVRKTVEKILRGGNDTAILSVEADVCQHCGERLYSQETIRQFEEIRAKLSSQQTAEFTPLGRTYQVKKAS